MSFRSCIKSPRGLGQFMPVTPRADMLDSRFTSPVLVVPRSDSSELWGICRAEVMFTPPVAVRPTRSPGCSLMTMAFFNRRRAIAVACRSVPLLPVMRESSGGLYPWLMSTFIRGDRRAGAILLSGSTTEPRMLLSGTPYVDRRLDSSDVSVLVREVVIASMHVRTVPGSRDG